jgi:hypothetical protein
MDQTHMNEKSCSICNQRFKTDRELQEHQKSMHEHDRGGTGSGRAGSLVILERESTNEAAKRLGKGGLK